jgi:hypothetical protein
MRAERSPHFLPRKSAPGETTIVITAARIGNQQHAVQSDGQ